MLFFFTRGVKSIRIIFNCLKNRNIIEFHFWDKLSHLHLINDSFSIFPHVKYYIVTLSYCIFSIKNFCILENLSWRLITCSTRTPPLSYNLFFSLFNDFLLCVLFHCRNAHFLVVVIIWFIMSFLSYILCMFLYCDEQDPLTSKPVCTS